MDPVDQRFVIISFGNILGTLKMSGSSGTGMSSRTLQMINERIESRDNSTLNPEITYILGSD